MAHNLEVVKTLIDMAAGAGAKVRLEANKEILMLSLSGIVSARSE